MAVLGKITRGIANLLARFVRGVNTSTVSCPDLVDPSVIVVNSTLKGKVEVGKNSVVRYSYVAGNVTIGRNTSLWGPNIEIYSTISPVRIGSFCSIARNVSIFEHNHRTDRCSTYYFSSNVFHENELNDVTSKGPIVIGNDVWIGAHAFIASGATIGDGAVIGANSVVTGVIPPYAVAAGCPAQVIKYRFDAEIIKRLLALKWWEWDDERIVRNRDLFLKPLTSNILDGIVE